MQHDVTLSKDEFSDFNVSTKPRKFNTAGVVLTGITGAVAVGISVIALPFVSPAIRKYCLPYVPATTSQLNNVLKALQSRSGKLVDLGSGDGRIVLETAKHNFESHGVELNPWLVGYSRISALRNGVGSKTKFFRKDLWKFKLTNYDNVVIFGVEQMMQDLEKKIVSECKTSCNIVACRFPLPNLRVLKVIGEGLDTVWVYDMRKSNL